jgi:hypothetical protein
MIDKEELNEFVQQCKKNNWGKKPSLVFTSKSLVTALEQTEIQEAVYDHTGLRLRISSAGPKTTTFELAN